jgi:hypothetical protein
VDGTLYVSRAVRVQLGRRTVRIERERSVLAADRAAGGGERSRERNVVELERLSASQLHREGRQAGLSAAGTRTIAATEEHVGSVAVVFSA